jgi:hypothetical protein
VSIDIIFKLGAPSWPKYKAQVAHSPLPANRFSSFQNENNPHRQEIFLNIQCYSFSILLRNPCQPDYMVFDLITYYRFIAWVSAVWTYPVPVDTHPIPVGNYKNSRVIICLESEHGVFYNQHIKGDVQSFMSYWVGVSMVAGAYVAFRTLPLRLRKARIDGWSSSTLCLAAASIGSIALAEGRYS